jgi:hypothetical protein
MERKFHQETLKLSFHALNYQLELTISNLMTFECVRNGPIYMIPQANVSMFKFPFLASNNQIYFVIGNLI